MYFATLFCNEHLRPLSVKSIEFI